jgi:hypothetical protein
MRPTTVLAVRDVCVVWVFAHIGIGIAIRPRQSPVAGSPFVQEMEEAWLFLCPRTRSLDRYAQALRTPITRTGPTTTGLEFLR